jgi:NAD(P)H dehydrogenase (quinone)
MHALIIVAHPEPKSLTHSVVSGIAAGISMSGADHTLEIADPAAEGFDPRFTSTDVALRQLEVPAPADVIAEQQRIDRASSLVLVYPVYWWSMPSLLKGISWR